MWTIRELINETQIEDNIILIQEGLFTYKEHSSSEQKLYKEETLFDQCAIIDVCV